MTAARPRVAFIGPKPDAPGGIAQFSANLIHAIQDDADVKVVSFRRLYPNWTKPGRLAPDASASGADIRSSPVLVPWRPLSWRAGLRELRAFEPDLVVVQWWHPLLGPALRYLAKRSDAPVLFVCHNGKPHERFPFSKLLSRRALRKADRLVALSNAVAEELRALAPEVPVDVLGHPPNLAAAVRSLNGRSAWRERIGPVDGPVILFFGHVRRYKGLEDLIAAMPFVRERIPATLVVAGRFFTPIKKVRDLVDRYGMSEFIRLHPGYVRGDEVGDLFSCADVVALPYRDASQSGIVAQAALFSRPVVATDVGGLAEALGDRGVLVPPADPAALADGLVQALRHPPPPPALPDVDWEDWRHALLQATSRNFRLVGMGEAS
jgi:glycosyltransferase involved in cell wall biosynthesis